MWTGLHCASGCAFKFVIPSVARNLFFAGSAQQPPRPEPQRPDPLKLHSQICVHQRNLWPPRSQDPRNPWRSSLVTNPIPAPACLSYFFPLRRPGSHGINNSSRAVVWLCQTIFVQLSPPVWHLKLKATIDPGHGIRIRGQSSSKGFERTSKRSFLKFKRFRLGMCRNIWPILPRKPRHIARKAFKRLNLGTSLSRERLLWHLSPPICTSNVQKLWKSCESIELTALPCAR